MNDATGFRLLPPAASDSAEATDRLLAAMFALCGTVALVLMVLVIVFAYRYRRGAAADHGEPVRRLRWLEITWTLSPLVLFLGGFAWATHDFMRRYTPPPDAMPVVVIAKQWMWKMQHRNGRREINELHLPLGQPVLLRMTSEDVIHSFFVPAFRIKHDVVPGRYAEIWFTPTRTGEFRLFCAEFCGASHAGMTGRVVVMPEAEFARWLAAGPSLPGLARQGFTLYRRLGCSGCHEPGSSVHAPPLEGLLGRRVHLRDGGSLIADENYIRDSILLPRKHVVAGYEPLMPSFAGQVDESAITALIEYLRSTGTRGGR